MDAERFDRLVESLTRSGSRRGALRTLTGAVLAAAGLGTLAERNAAAKDQSKSTRRGGGKAKGRKDKTPVRAQAKTCCKSGNCAPGTGKNLAQCCYEGQDLSGKNFRSANLGNANLSGAILTKANFTSANLDKTCLVDADLTGAKLNGANTASAIFCRTQTSQGIDNSGCDKANACCQTCVDIGATGCNIGGECCGGAECAGNGDGTCTCPQDAPDTCDGVCVDLQTDEENCGECGETCADGETCQSGVCRCGSGPACTGRLTCCSGQCVDLLTDLDNCTECGNSCPRPLANAEVECGPGFDENDRPGYGCTYLCQSNYRDCDGDPFNGCERAIFDDPNNCGDCDNTCPAGSPRCCGCRCQPPPPSTTCSTCQAVGNARLIRRR